MNTRSTARSVGRIAVLTSAAAISLTACASSATHTGQQAGAKPPAVSTSPSPTPTPTTIASLQDAAKQAMAGVTSVQIGMTVDAAGMHITGTGQEAVANGKPTGVELVETVPSVGEISVVVTGGKVYFQLPAALRPAGSKPWFYVDASSGNAMAAQLLQSVNQLGSDATSKYLQSVTNLKLVGQDTVDGVPATHYSMVVDPTAAPLDAATRSQLTKAGIKSVPMDMWFDSSYRPVRMLMSVKTTAGVVKTTMSFSDYNALVSVDAPPAAQVQPLPAGFGNG